MPPRRDLEDAIAGFALGLLLCVVGAFVLGATVECLAWR